MGIEFLFARKEKLSLSCWRGLDMTWLCTLGFCMNWVGMGVYIQERPTDLLAYLLFHTFELTVGAGGLDRSGCDADFSLG